jgi:hypothetical protein
MVKPIAVAKVGLGFTAGGLAVMIGVPYLLPMTLDVSILFSTLLQLERAGQLLIVLGAAMSLVAGCCFQRS